MSKARRDPDLVRAYVRTGGRSRPTRTLDLVTLVIATREPDLAAAADQRRILGLCTHPLSIAEIAAHLDLPPSVVKIVVSDLLDTEHLTIPTPTEVLPDIALLEEVLNGLRALAV